MSRRTTIRILLVFALAVVWHALLATGLSTSSKSEQVTASSSAITPTHLPANHASSARVRQ